MNANPAYKEILKLYHLLKSAEIPCFCTQIADGWKIVYYTRKSGEISDAVESELTCNGASDEIEIMNLAFLSEILKIRIPSKIVRLEDMVLGHLSALTVFLFWSLHYRKTNPTEFNAGAYFRTWKALLRSPYSRRKYQRVIELLETFTEISVNQLDKVGAVELIEVLSVSVITNNTDFINTVTKYKTRKHLIGYIIDELIDNAIFMRYHEIQMMLTNYKYENNLFHEKEFEL